MGTKLRFKKSKRAVSTKDVSAASSVQKVSDESAQNVNSSGSWRRACGLAPGITPVRRKPRFLSGKQHELFNASIQSGLNNTVLQKIKLTIN